MANLKKKSQSPIVTHQNVLESLKDLGGGTAIQTKDLLKDTSSDFLRELLGLSLPKVKRSGEITPGETLQMSDVLSGKKEKEGKVKNQIRIENQMVSEEARISKEKGEKLRAELQAIMEEMKKTSESMGNLAEATQASMVAAPIEPGIYHVGFFTNLLEFLQSFRKRVDLTVTWMQSTNKRAEKKNYWAMYKKKGSSFLLAPDHYSQRSAG